MSQVRLLPAIRAYAYLPQSSPHRRLPRHPERQRPAHFFESYEDRLLYYDCFWHHDGSQVLLVGPPPMNLKPLQDQARFTALPSGQALAPQFFASVSTQITALPAVPPDTVSIGIDMAGERFTLRIQPSSVDELAGHRVIFTMSKNNDLGWIAEWAHYHARLQGATAVVFFDNGSDRYAPRNIRRTLLEVPGIEKVAVHSWPFRYGHPDHWVKNNPFYVQFLQVSAMSVALRRYAARAEGLMNCDIDELITAPPGTTAFDLARQSRHGLLVMRGQFIAPVPNDGVAPADRRHRDYSMRDRDALTRLSKPKKWVLDPSRPWVQKLSTHPYMHWVQGRPWLGKTYVKGTFYWHLKGISTNWKDQRAHFTHDELKRLEIDLAFVETMRRL